MTRDPEAKECFIREAKAASALDHPNICVVRDIGETDDGSLFIAMACYKGETLKKKIQRGALELDDAIDIAVQIAGGLAKLRGQSLHTKAGRTQGTIAYMSPEQALGNNIDHRTDIWSLGNKGYASRTKAWAPHLFGD